MCMPPPSVCIFPCRILDAALALGERRAGAGDTASENEHFGGCVARGSQKYIPVGIDVFNHDAIPNMRGTHLRRAEIARAISAEEK